MAVKLVPSDRRGFRFVGLSTDAKPTQQNGVTLPAGSTFFEEDSGLLFVFSGDGTWTQKAIGNVGVNNFPATQNVDGTVALTPVGKSASATQTRPDNTTAYDALDVVGTDAATNMEFADLSLNEGGLVAIMGVRLRIDASAIPATMGAFRLHLYSSAPTPITDNVAYNLPSADRDNYLTYVDIPAPIDLGDTLFAKDENLNVTVKLAEGSRSLYGILQTIAEYTPTAEVVKTVTLNVAEV